MSHIMGITFRSMNISQLVIWFYIQLSWMVYGMWLSESSLVTGKQGLCQAAVLCNIWFQDTDCF